MRSQEFRDFDAFADSVQGVDSKMMLRNPKRRVWSIGGVDLGRIDVQLGRLGSGNIAQGELRSDGFMLYLPLSESVKYTANGDVLEPNSFAILEPGCEFCISTMVEHVWCTAFIPTDMFEGSDHLTVPDFRSCRVTRPNHQAVDQFRTILLQVFNAAASSAFFETSPAATHAADAVLRIANSIIERKQAVDPIHEGRPRIPRTEIIRRSMELLDRQAENRVTVRELAAAATVCERTLRTAFNEYFGVGPVRYLQLRHLHLVHRALKAADPNEGSVTQILVAHGEWAFSRFAKRYRRQFGELPSATLRTRRNV